MPRRIKSKFNISISSSLKKVRKKVEISSYKASIDTAEFIKDNIKKNDLMDISKTGNMRTYLGYNIYGGTEYYRVIGFSFNDKYVPYWKVIEYGFKGIQRIREHLRRITMAWGKRIEPKVVSVRAHNRKVNRPEKAILRKNLKKNLKDYRKFYIQKIKDYSGYRSKGR